MTREEAIRIATGLRTDFKCESDTMVDFCNTVIKALEQQDKLKDFFMRDCESCRVHMLSVKPATQWHKVEDELPDIDEEVLVNDGSDMFVAWWVDDGFESKWHSFDGRYDTNTPILAWMPLPEWEE